MQNKNNYFITIEGVEGAGKSTAVKILQTYLDQKNVDYVLTREPGGTDIAECIRRVLLGDYNEEMSADTELLLMFAGRSQNINQVINPALQNGQWVLSDRFTDASFAYQGGGRGVPVKHINDLAQWVQGDLAPDLTFLMDIPVEEGMKRISSRGAKDRIEREGLEFFNRVRQTYLNRAKAEPDRFVMIDASQSLDVVHNQLTKKLSKLMSVCP